MIVALAYYHGNKLPLWVMNVPPMLVLKHVDNGMFKVSYATYQVIVDLLLRDDMLPSCELSQFYVPQIISTVSWNLSVSFPPGAFSSFLSFLGVFRLDYLSLDCARFEDFFSLHSFLSLSSSVD
jgi:hypothetical protein